MESEFRYKFDRDPDVETKENLEEFWRVLAKLIEQGGDLSAQTKNLLRARIQSILAALGIKSLEDYKGLAALNERLSVKSRLPEPKGYPAREDFEHHLRKVYHDQGHERLPEIPRIIQASDVAKHGQSDWIHLTSRGIKSGVDYLYDLGKVLASELAYTASFDQTDALTVGLHWNIENGRHRALALRALGSTYVSAMGMDRWVEVIKEK